MNLKGKKKGVLLLVLLLVLLVCGGIYTGYRLHPESFVGKNDIITRGEFAADLAKELKLDTGSAVKDPPTFSDIDGHWAEKYIEALVNAGIIDPADYPDGFKPDEPITRAEIIKMLVRVKGQDDEAKNTQGHSGYDDQSDIPDDDKGYAIVGKEDGIIGDTGDGKLHPNDPVTKGEADDMTGKADPKPVTPTPSSPASDTPTPSNPEQPTPTPSEPEKPTPAPTPTPTPGGSDSGDSGGSYYYPDAQVRFELPETAHTDTEIKVMFRTDEMESYLSEQKGLSVKWTPGTYDSLASGTIDTEGNPQVLKKCRIHQLKPNADVMTQEHLVDALYTEMAEFSFLTKYIFGTGIEEIDVNAWNDVEVQYSSGVTKKLDERFDSPEHAVNVVRRMLHDMEQQTTDSPDQGVRLC